MKIKLSPREINHLDAAAVILEEYSRIYSEMVKDKTGMFFDDAGSAAGMIRKLIENNND